MEKNHKGCNRSKKDPAAYRLGLDTRTKRESDVAHLLDITHYLHRTVGEQELQPTYIFLSYPHSDSKSRS